ncbi:CLUMA_CG017718, isoform A [Clunio marinus]|uniref:CLUMA_CG017718, isoform A n=1 Tax=Clunio marinus TaxID=568069 RepID=A0A1J1IZQ8_9DIPT|nr:CLUMA_CG017718, isoform A [Clunio marinus]
MFCVRDIVKEAEGLNERERWKERKEKALTREKKGRHGNCFCNAMEAEMRKTFLLKFPAIVLIDDNEQRQEND